MAAAGGRAYFVVSTYQALPDTEGEKNGGGTPGVAIARGGGEYHAASWWHPSPFLSLYVCMGPLPSRRKDLRFCRQGPEARSIKKQQGTLD